MKKEVKSTAEAERLLKEQMGPESPGIRHHYFVIEFDRDYFNRTGWRTGRLITHIKKLER